MPSLNNAHIQELRNAQAEFLRTIHSLSNEEFVREIPGKWTAGQHVLHLFLTTQPVNIGLGLPKFLLKLLFGKCSRSPLDYDGVRSAYSAKLTGGAKSPKMYVPKAVALDQREKVIGLFTGATDRLMVLAEQYDDAQLDLVQLPHPLLGKITAREMLYFCAFHSRVHQAAVQRDLGR
jgi:hypothetical protein